MYSLSRAALFTIFILIGPVACGGGGDSGSAGATTEEGTTPIDESNERTLHGTYAVTSMQITDGVETIRSTDLDFFDHRFTINVDTRIIAQRIEMRDDDRGIDFFDYTENNIDSDPDVSVDELYANQTGPYTLTIFYNDICDAFVCFDMLIRLRKTSDRVQNLLAKGLDLDDSGPTLKQRLAKMFLEIKYPGATSP